MTLARRLFSFKGRIRRRDWWAFSIGLYAAELVVVKIIELVIDGPSIDLLEYNVFSWLFGEPANPRMMAISAIIMIALMWPNLALTAKRAHDLNTKGYWLIGAMLVPYTIYFLPSGLMERAGRALDDSDLIGGLPLILQVTLALGVLAAILVLGFLDGTRGPNRFGRSPKSNGGDAARTTAEVFE